MTPEQIAAMFRAYTRAMAIATGRSAESLSSVIATELEDEARRGVDDGVSDAIKFTVAALRERRTFPGD